MKTAAGVVQVCQDWDAATAPTEQTGALNTMNATARVAQTIQDRGTVTAPAGGGQEREQLEIGSQSRADLSGPGRSYCPGEQIGAL